jgi:hypothetical protein
VDLRIGGGLASGEAIAVDLERRGADLRRGYGCGSGEEECGSPERLWVWIRRGGGARAVARRALDGERAPLSDE